MMVRCVATRVAFLSAEQRSRGSHDDGEYPLSVGREYVTVGMSLDENTLSFLVQDDWGGPCFAPAGLFELGEFDIPPEWEFGLCSGIRASGRDLWRHPEQAIWGYPELVRDPGHAGRLGEREYADLAVFHSRICDAEAAERQTPHGTTLAEAIVTMTDWSRYETSGESETSFGEILSTLVATPTLPERRELWRWLRRDSLSTSDAGGSAEPLIPVLLATLIDERSVDILSIALEILFSLVDRARQRNDELGRDCLRSAAAGGWLVAQVAVMNPCLAQRCLSILDIVSRDCAGFARLVCAEAPPSP